MAKESNVTHLDKFGRIKLPASFRRAVEETSENEVFVTSKDDKNIQIYPLTAWFDLVDNLHKEKRDDPLMRRFLMKTNYNGQKARVDRYGRVQIPSFLRKKIGPEGKIAINLREDHLELMSS
jgi:DNA-binding transcriptional regulator/RsmH inhibitor MraZ